MFKMNSVFQWIISIGLILYVGYSTYKSVRGFVQYKKKSKAYLDTHKDAKQFFCGVWQCVILVIMTIGCLGMAVAAPYFVSDDSQLLLYRVAYLCIAIVFAGLVAEMWIHRTIIFSQDGFFIGTQSYRYRMIITLEKRKGIIHNIKVLFQNGDVIEVSQKIGELIRERFNAFKAQKKEKKERRKR